MHAVVPALTAFTLTVVSYLFFYRLPAGSAVRAFFCDRGMYQHLGLFLTLYGVALAVQKLHRFGTERASLRYQLPDQTITADDADVFSRRMPDEYRHSILGRRIEELLRGFARHEEVGPLVERTTKADREGLDRSYTLLSWIRTLPPIVGLLGTLDGLRSGTRNLAELSGAATLSEIRGSLQDFALSSSTAFDTTLLGISGALVLAAMIFVLQRRELDHLNEVDRRAEDLARRFQRPPRVDVALQQLAHNFTSNFFQMLDVSLGGAAVKLAELVRTPSAGTAPGERHAAVTRSE